DLLAGVVAAGGVVEGPVRVTGGPRTAHALEDLKGPQDLVTAAVRAIPNHSEYADWIRVGVALRAASLDWPEAGLALWLEWSARWQGTGDPRVEDPETWEAKWASFRHPFSLGADYLYDLATRHGWERGLAA